MVDNKSSPYVLCTAIQFKLHTSFISVPFLITAQYYRPFRVLITLDSCCNTNDPISLLLLQHCKGRLSGCVAKPCQLKRKKKRKTIYLELNKEQAEHNILLPEHCRRYMESFSNYRDMYFNIDISYLVPIFPTPQPQCTIYFTYITCFLSLSVNSL